MVENKTFLSRLFDIINVLILVLLAVSCLYPLWYTFCVSVSDKVAVSSGQVTMFPIGFNVNSYKLVMGDGKFWNSFWISVQRVLYGTVFTMVVIIMMAYPLSKNKREYKPRNAMMWILIFCMLFNGGTIPWFITVKTYDLLDTMAALVLAGSVPVFNVILLMNFFRNLPSDLEEAAAIDGAGPWRILWQIVVPCSVPVIATVVLERVLPGPGADVQRRHVPPADLHQADCGADSCGRDPDRGAVSAAEPELQQSAGSSQGVYRHDSHADCIPLPAEVLCQRHHPGRGEGITPFRGDAVA